MLLLTLIIGSFRCLLKIWSFVFLFVDFSWRLLKREDDLHRFTLRLRSLFVTPLLYCQEVVALYRFILLANILLFHLNLLTKQRNKQCGIS